MIAGQPSSVDIGAAREGFDDNPITDAHVFIEDRAFNVAVGSNAHGDGVVPQGGAIVIIAAQHDAVDDF